MNETDFCEHVLDPGERRIVFRLLRYLCHERRCLPEEEYDAVVALGDLELASDAAHHAVVHFYVEEGQKKHGARRIKNLPAFMKRFCKWSRTPWDDVVALVKKHTLEFKRVIESWYQDDENRVKLHEEMRHDADALMRRRRQRSA